MNAIARPVVPAVLLALPSSTLAADGAPSLGATLQAFAGLGLVLALIVATAFVLKRVQPGRFAASSLLKPVATLAVGARERVVIVELGDEWLVLGVTPQSVNLLHATARRQLADAAEPPRPAFADWLARARGVRSDL